MPNEPTSGAPPTQVETPPTGQTPPANTPTTDPAAPTTETDPKVEAPKVGEEPKAGDPPKEGEPAAPEPVTREALKLPDGMTVDDETMASFIELTNDAEKSPAERAQAMVDLHTSLMQKASEAASQQWTELQDKWTETIKADPEIGGDRLDPALGQISKMLDTHGSPEVREAFDLTGAGNNPAIIKFLHKLAVQVGEGTPTAGTPTARSEEDRARNLFPSMTK